MKCIPVIPQLIASLSPCFGQDRYSPKNALLRTCSISLVLLWSQVSASQQITVKLVDGRNGHTMNHHAVEVWVVSGPEGEVGAPVYLATGTDGTAVFRIPTGAQSFIIAGVTLADCRRAKAANNAVNEDVYHFADVLTSGVVAKNKCGKTSVQAVPGQIVFFVRPPHWWEKVMWE